MNTSEIASGFSQSQQGFGEIDLGEAYLSFQLDEQNPAAFSMEQVKEVIVVPANQITPMPNMPEYVLGLLARRSRVMWVVDLAQMLTSQPYLSKTHQYKVIIIQVNQASKQQNILLGSSQNQALFGVIVQEVKGGIQLAANLIQSPPENLPLNLIPCLRGCVMQPNNMLLVLDAEAIVRSPILPSN